MSKSWNVCYCISHVAAIIWKFCWNVCLAIVLDHLQDQILDFFKSFKTERANINQEKFQTNYFEVDLQTKKEVTSFCLLKLEEMHARDDHKEFLQLALITMGTMLCTLKEEESYHFIAPGATRRTR